MPCEVAAWTSRITTRAAVDEHLARVGLLDAPDDPHQGGLAGAVFAEQGDDFTGVRVEARGAQGVHARKPLLDVPKLKDGRAHDVGRAAGGQRPRSCTSFDLKSSTLFCRMTIVGMNIWRLAGIPDRSPLSGLRQQRDRLVAELERLLHHGADDRAGLDARQRLVVLVERDDLDLADLAGVADRVEDRGTVVAPEPDERGDVGMAHEHLGDVRFRADLIGIVRADVDDLDLRAGDRLLDALQPLLGVARVELADEQRDPAALWQCFLDQSPACRPAATLSVPT